MNATRNPTILVVDDDSDLLELMKRGFEREGYHVVARGTPPAKEEVEHIDPALIIMDVGLGDENGAALCHAIKRDGIRTDHHVVLISGHPRELLDMEAGSALADEAVSKPFNMHTLLDLAAYYAPVN